MQAIDVRDSWGATLREKEAEFRVWAPAVNRLRLRLNGVEHAMQAENGWWRASLPAAAGDRYSFLLDDGSAVPDPAARAMAGGLRGRGDDRRPERLPLAPPGLARPALGGDGDLRDPRRHLHRSRHVPGGDRAAASPRRRRDHRRRADAAGAVRGRARLGLRRRAALRAARRLRHARRPPGARRRGARARADGVPRRRLQPLRARGKPAAAAGAGLLPRRAAYPLGRGDRLRAPGRAAVLHRQRPDVAGGIPVRRAEVRRGRPHPGRGRRGGDPRSRWRGRSARASPTGTCILRPRTTATSSTCIPGATGGRCCIPPSGTTTCTTSRTSSPPARPRATTSTSPSITGRSTPGRWPRASPTRASRRATRTDGRAASRAPASRRSPSSTSCRTTTRSATARSASG